MIQYEQLARRDRGDPARDDAGGAGGGEGATARKAAASSDAVEKRTGKDGKVARATAVCRIWVRQALMFFNSGARVPGGLTSCSD
jgi:hypothetical protein